jgi:hypothetical protein
MSSVRSFLDSELRPVHLSVICLAFFVSWPAVAQTARVVVVEQNEHQHAANCSNAARFLTRGIPETQQAWAHETILGCSREAPAALAASIRRLATSRDIAALSLLKRSALYVADDRVFDAALDVATQTTASPEARTAGFLIAAMEAKDLLDFDFANIVASTEPIVGCVGGHFNHSMRGAANTPPAPTAGNRLRVAMTSALEALDTPLPVRNAALCIGQTARALP